MTAADQARDTMRRNIQSLTGTSVVAWKTRIRRKGLERHGEIVRWLKAEHGVTHGYATFIALEATHGNSASASDQVASLFRGPKAKLRPVASPEDVDAELKKWRRRAYDAAGVTIAPSRGPDS